MTRRSRIRRTRTRRAAQVHREPKQRSANRLRLRTSRSRNHTAVPATDGVGLGRRAAPKRRRLLDKYGWYEQRPEGAWTTTRQAEALNLAGSRRASRYEGVVAGLNIVSGELEILDPFALYGEEISGINVCVIGDIGQGKSALIKTAFGLRQLIADRQVVILDKKPQSGHGEYTPIAQMLGAASIRFQTGGGGACVNLLDAAISTGGEHVGGLSGIVPAGQEALVLAVLADSMGRELDEREKSVVGLALELVNSEARDQGRAPVIRELAMRLLDPNTGDFDTVGGRWADRGLEWGVEPGLALLRLADRDLKGLVDAETSPEIRDSLETHPLVHFDLSALPTDGPALRVVMTVINTWLANRLAARSSRFAQTILLVEEGWHVAQGSTGEVFQTNMKLSRGLGLCTVSAFHHISDLPGDSPARALMQEASIVVLMGQGREDDVRETCRMYRLPPGTEETLMRLGRGQALVKIGRRDPFLLQHIRSPLEVALTDTDSAVKGNAA
ncbi:ATP/GTP-binding protein [Nocardia terpenica]|uniref:ATP/GTP-binding protein n=1 Tax=Nocardia terpenica TaxID=455432 RepID=UPI0018E0C2D6|nr:ATP/GTP-binding protein [Nocardia terpenica]